MIPILYTGTETSFTSNGLGRLTDIIECVCTEERNGIYEVEFTYPITGKFYRQMVSMVEALSIGDYANSGIIACIHDDKHDIQPFDIYSVSSPIDGVATFNAHHVSYRLSGMVVTPFTATSCADAFLQIPLKIVGTHPFDFWTDKATNGSFELETIANVRNILGGEEGSILDIFGTGEYLFDKFHVKLYLNRGTNSGVTIRYGKNLTDLTRDIDSSGHYNAVAPFWKGQVTDEDTGESEEVIVTLTNVYVKGSGITADPVIAVVDFSSDFEEQPTQNELQARAVQYLSNNQPWIPDDSIKVSFVQLWQTEEYADVAILQRLSLCDQISVYYEDLGVVATEQEIIKVVYNVILERYDEMELGKPDTSLSNSISEAARASFEDEIKKAKQASVNNSMLQAAIAHATELITGGLGGHVIFNLNSDGEPQEILIMDTDDPSTAVNVIRMNQNGIGFSTTGYNGPFTTAWTIDGAFNAAFITTGTILANIIHGGTLALGGANNGNGVMRVYDANNNEIETVDTTGMSFYGTKSISLGGSGYWTAYSNDPDSPYINEIPERYNYTPTTDPTKDWYKRKLKILSGGIRFSRIVTNNSTGAIQPTEVEEGFIRSTGDPGIQIYAKNKLSLYGCYNNSSGGYTGIALGETITHPSNSTYDWRTTSSMIGVYADELNLGYISLVFGINNEFFEILTPGSGNLTLLGYDGSRGNRHAWHFDNSNGDFETDRLLVNSVYVWGDKSRVAGTEDYSDRVLYCYETPTPLFGDIGDGVLDETGECYVFLDPVFSETVDTSHQYQVFLQAYGDGICWISKRTPEYFVVKGTPNLEFGWELKAKQYDYDNKRLEKYVKKEKPMTDEDFHDYGEESLSYIRELYEGRMSEE